MAINPNLATWLRRASGAMLLLLVGCAPPPAPTASTQVAGIALGQARIWVYRDIDTYESNGRPYVRFNGAVQGIAEKNGTFYRDVVPGTYVVTVDSYGVDVGQTAQLSLAAGQEAFIKIVSLGNWDDMSGRRGGGGHDTFYAWLMRPEIGRAEVAQHSFFGGGPMMAALSPH
jgi:hypothetical protein